MELFETSKGKPAALYKGYQYRIRRTTLDNRITWICANEKSQRCKGQMVTKDNEILKTNQHSCIPDITKGEVKKQISLAKKRVREESVPVSQIFKDEIAPLVNRSFEFLAEVPAYSSIKSSFYRIRRLKQLDGKKNSLSKPSIKHGSEEASQSYNVVVLHDSSETSEQSSQSNNEIQESQNNGVHWQFTTTSLRERIDVLHNLMPFVDVRFRVENRHPDGQRVDIQYFSAHKLILSACSPVFAEMFYKSITNSSEDEIPNSADSDRRVTDVHTEAFKLMLEYMYGKEDELTFPKGIIALKTYYAAKKYKIPHLQELCSSYLREEEIAIEDCIDVLEDPVHLEITGLHQKCIDKAEDKPLEAVNYAARIASPETIKSLLEMERMAVTSELSLLRALVEGCRIRCHQETDSEINIASFKTFLEQFLPCIRFLTMTPQEFALALEICESVISINDSHSIMLALSHPGTRNFNVPPWCNQTTRSRMGQARSISAFQILPSNPIFRDYNPAEEPAGLISSLDIKVFGGTFTFTGIGIHCRRIVADDQNLDDVPSARYTINLRNNASGIAFEQVKKITMQSNHLALQFPIPLPVSDNQEAKVSVILDNVIGLDFTTFQNRNMRFDEGNRWFEIRLNNYRVHDDTFAIEKLFYSA